MRFATLAVLASAGFAAAQTSSASSPSATGGSDSCQAQNIVDACKEGIQKQIDDCSANDWICLCDNYTNLLTCYNNCPDSNERPPVQNSVTQYCNAAAPLKSSSASVAATAGTSAAPQATSAGTATTGGPAATGFGSGSASATGASNTGAADALAVPVGGALAVLLGVAGLL